MSTPSKPVPVRIPPDMVARLDQLRGLVPRETYVRDILSRALAAEERKAKTGTKAKAGTKAKTGTRR